MRCRRKKTERIKTNLKLIKLVKIVLKSKPEEKLLVNDWAFKGIAISEDKDINPKIIWADGTEEELLRFWLNEPITKPIEKDRKPLHRKEFSH